jgi:membrane protein YdbS with pleckstrin-like domain
MVKKVLLKYSVILVINLLAFLSVWYILDKTFETNWKFIALFLVLSIVSLVILTQNLVRNNLNKLENIKEAVKNNIKK